MTEDQTKTKTIDKEQDTIESDIEQEDSIETDNRSNVTTDDEFYNELMNSPAEIEDHLIPDGCTDVISGIEHLTSCLNRRYDSCPVVFTGSLKDAVNEALNSKERRPLLIYINNDKSVYSNVFCKQILCHEKIVEYFLANYVLWAWDVTFLSNGKKMNEMFTTTFPLRMVGKLIGTEADEQYPLLIGVRHDTNGEYFFNRLIDGSTKRPDIDEFLARLIEFKDRFDDSEIDLEKAKEETKSHFMHTVHHINDLHRRSKPNYTPDFSRPTTMYPSLTRFPSEESNEQFFPRRINLSDAFRRLSMDSDDDDDERTPTIERPSLRFPK